MNHWEDENCKCKGCNTCMHCGKELGKGFNDCEHCFNEDWDK